MNHVDPSGTIAFLLVTGIIGAVIGGIVGGIAQPSKAKVFGAASARALSSAVTGQEAKLVSESKSDCSKTATAPEKSFREKRIGTIS